MKAEEFILARREAKIREGKNYISFEQLFIHLNTFYFQYFHDYFGVKHPPECSDSIFAKWLLDDNFNLEEDILTYVDEEDEDILDEMTLRYFLTLPKYKKYLIQEALLNIESGKEKPESYSNLFIRKDAAEELGDAALSAFIEFMEGDLDTFPDYRLILKLEEDLEFQLEMKIEELTEEIEKLSDELESLKSDSTKPKNIVNSNGGKTKTENKKAEVIAALAAMYTKTDCSKPYEAAETILQEWQRQTEALGKAPSKETLAAYIKAGVERIKP